MKTINDLILLYIEYLQILNRSKYTIRNQRVRLITFSLYLKTNFKLKYPSELLPGYFVKWHGSLKLMMNNGHPLKASSINHHIKAVRGWLDYLFKNDYTRLEFTDYLPYLKTPKVLSTSVLPHAKVKSLLAKVSTENATGARNRAMLELLYTAGIRPRELLGLNVQDIDFRNKTALVNGKGEKQRLVPIGKTAIRYLESYIKAVRPFQLKYKYEQALFVNIDGNRVKYGTFSKILSQAVKKINTDCPVTLHTFRRSCATELIRGGANIYHVKELLGHESLKTMNHYVRLTITDLKKTHAKCHPREKD